MNHDPYAFAAAHFNQSRVKEIVDAADAILNKNNLPGESYKTSLEAKFLKIIAFQHLLQASGAPEEIQGGFRTTIATIFGAEILAAPKTFTRVSDAFKADTHDLIRSCRE